MSIILLLKILDGLMFFGIILLVGVIIKESRIYGKKHLFNQEIKLTKGMIVQKEVEIEVAWKVLNKIQAEREKTMKKIEENVEAIAEEKKKTPMDMEKIKALATENVRLGKTDKRAKNNDIMWAGEILEKDIRAERVIEEITTLVGKREYIKTKIDTLLAMKKSGYHKNFDKFFNEELSKNERFNPKTKEEDKN